MLRTVHFDNQLCRSAVKIHDKSANNPLFVNLCRVFAEKKILELAFIGSHFPAKPPGVFQLAIVFWYGHILPSPSSLRSATSPKGRGKSLSVGFAATSPKGRAKYRTQCTTLNRCIEVRPLSIRHIGIWCSITISSKRCASKNQLLRK